MLWCAVPVLCAHIAARNVLPLRSHKAVNELSASGQHSSQGGTTSQRPVNGHGRVVTCTTAHELALHQQLPCSTAAMTHQTGVTPLHSVTAPTARTVCLARCSFVIVPPEYNAASLLSVSALRRCLFNTENVSWLSSVGSRGLLLVCMMAPGGCGTHIAADMA